MCSGEILRCSCVIRVLYESCFGHWLISQCLGSFLPSFHEIICMFLLVLFQILIAADGLLGLVSWIYLRLSVLFFFFNVWVFPWNQLFFIIFSAGDTFWYIFIWLIVSFTNFLFGSFYYLYYLLSLSSDFGLSPLIYHLFHFGNFLGQEYIFLFFISLFKSSML